ncbi:MAG: nucleotide exchange factor GrpE [Deltaproteobacteria bacterium RBG_16_48_10]|nr:MAG: nucleotide exchange factor GrpE [Deltaproteobacteria bacterium RBG_16_48_10]
MRDRKKKEDKERIDPEKENESLPELLTGPSLIVEEKGEGENKEVEELKKKLEEKEKEAKENYGRFLRMAADFENYKKRAAREKEDYIKFATEDLMKAILPFIDNLERAVNHAEKVNDTGVMIEGVRLTIQQILQALNKFGLSSFKSVGKPFDPAMHEAMLVVETDQQEPDQVLEEFQKGYLLFNRLLRPATVSVSKVPEKEAQAS